ncbi:MAG: 50S ribosomal protein L24 [Nitrospiraceae bacterium]
MSAQVIAKTKIRKGDTVMVIAGRERGKTGKVLSLQLPKAKLTVEKLNMIKRHTKPNQKTRQGGIIEREAPLAISNVMFLCANCNKPVRLGIKALEDGRRVRICRKCQEVIEKT